MPSQPVPAKVCLVQDDRYLKAHRHTHRNLLLFGEAIVQLVKSVIRTVNLPSDSCLPIPFDPAFSSSSLALLPGHVTWFHPLEAMTDRR